MIPALALGLGALIALERDQGRAGGWLWLAAIQAAAVPFFKVFLGAHLLLGLAVSAILGRRPLRHALAVALPCALATALLVLGQGGRTVDVALAPLDLVRITRESLALPPLSGLALAGWAMLVAGGVPGPAAARPRRGLARAAPRPVGRLRAGGDGARRLAAGPAVPRLRPRDASKDRRR